MTESEHETSITAAGAEEQLRKDTRSQSSPAERDDDDQVTTTIEQEQQGFPDQPTTS